jgi:hypothetical protein
MFEALTVPFGAKMLFNTVKLKPGTTMEDVELAIGEMCNVVKNSYGGEAGGFLGGQVFRFSGFVSEEGSLGGARPADGHVAIVTYWRSFEEHERSHGDEVFKDRFAALEAMCTQSQELGYDMMWQGEPEAAKHSCLKTGQPKSVSS